MQKLVLRHSCSVFSFAKGKSWDEFYLKYAWNGQKYALMRLGLCNSAFTIAQEMDCLTDDVKKRIDICIEKYRTVLD